MILIEYILFLQGAHEPLRKRFRRLNRKLVLVATKSSYKADADKYIMIDKLFSPTQELSDIQPHANLWVCGVECAETETKAGKAEVQVQEQMQAPMECESALPKITAFGDAPSNKTHSGGGGGAGDDQRASEDSIRVACVIFYFSIYCMTEYLANIMILYHDYYRHAGT